MKLLAGAAGDQIALHNESYYPENPIPSLKLSAEQRERISLLTREDVARIDNWLMSFAIRRGRKIAFLVGQSMLQLESEIPNVPDVFYILRVQKLIDEKRLEVEGDIINNWLGCEVLLPKGEIEWK